MEDTTDLIFSFQSSSWTQAFVDLKVSKCAVEVQTLACSWNAVTVFHRKTCS